MNKSMQNFVKSILDYIIYFGQCHQLLYFLLLQIHLNYFRFCFVFILSNWYDWCEIVNDTSNEFGCVYQNGAHTIEFKIMKFSLFFLRNQVDQNIYFIPWTSIFSWCCVVSVTFSFSILFIWRCFLWCLKMRIPSIMNIQIIVI